MKQILQNLKTGSTEVSNIPSPKITDNEILIKSNYSLISSGTEKMLLDFANANYLNKALKQPEKVKVVLNKIRTDGLKTTLNSVMSKLDQPMQMGYSNVGIVCEVGKKITNVKVGDRVLSNGSHAEIVKVSKNLFAKIPNNVPDEEAVFGVIGSVALQSVRLAAPTLGESAVVFGLGLIGLMTVQILIANGCKVLGVDYDKEKLKLAKGFGAEVVDLQKGEDPLLSAQNFSKSKGIDLVIIAADSKDSSIVEQASLISRKRGRIVLSGVVGLNFSRTNLYEKELTFQVSCSYGPGRYDLEYESLGIDYPRSFVRWTAQRNFETVLDLMTDRRIDVRDLVSHRFKVQNANLAYNKLLSKEKNLGILIKYDSKNFTHKTDTVYFYKTEHDFKKKNNKKDNDVNVGFIGSGNYVRSILVKAFQKTELKLKSISSISGVSSYFVAKKYKFEEVTTNIDSIFLDKKINAVVIATHHNSHADYIVKALNSNKNVFVEKPLCLSFDELNTIKSTYKKIIEANKFKPILMVGFNRRFSPLILKAKDYLNTKIGPKSIIITVNAGSIPSDHWIQDLSIGGGRIIGEVCHFIDLLRHLTESSIVSENAIFMKSELNDTLSIFLKFEDGSIGTIHYFANGNNFVQKERIDIYASSGIIQIENFKTLKSYGFPKSKNINLWSQDKGQNACVEQFAKAIFNDLSDPIPIHEIFEVAEVTLKLANKLKQNK